MTTTKKDTHRVLNFKHIERAGTFCDELANHFSFWAPHVNCSIERDEDDVGVFFWVAIDVGRDSKGGDIAYHFAQGYTAGRRIGFTEGIDAITARRKERIEA